MTASRRVAIAATIAAALLCGPLSAAAPIAGADPAAPSSPAPAAPPAPAPPLPLGQYTNPVYHWTLTYPDWYSVDSADPQWTKFRAFDPPREVGVHSVAGMMLGSPDQLADRQLDFDRQYFGSKGMTVQVVFRNPVTLPNGVPAVELVKDMVPGGRSHDLFAVMGDRGFILSAETYVKFWDQVSAEFDQILHSFTVDQPR